MASHLARASPIGLTMLHAAIAPALTSGVEGWSFSSRMAIIELKGSPVASAPIHGEQFLGTKLSQGQYGGVYFRYRLYAECILRVACFYASAVEQAYTDAEETAVYLGKVGNIVGIFPVGILLIQVVGLLHGLLYGRKSEVPFHDLISYGCDNRRCG